MSSSSGAGGGTTTGGGGGGGSGGGPCGACKFLRRKCVAGCVFAPWFEAEGGASQFAAVHKVFGASNVSKLLHHLPPHRRFDAVATICFEAQARIRDPVHGCVAHILALQQQVVNLQTELSYLQAHLAALELPSPPPPPPPPIQTLATPPPPLSVPDLPPPSSAPISYDLSSLFDPVLLPSGWAAAAHQHQLQHRQVSPDQFENAGRHRNPGDICGSTGSIAGGGDLHELARDLFHRDGGSPTEPTVAPPTSEASSSSHHFSK